MNELINEQIAQLTAERDALAAHVEALRKALAALSVQAESALQEDVICYSALKRAQREADEVLDKAPQHHLRQVRADAGRSGYLQGHLDAGGSASDWNKKHSEHHASQYHASILASKE